MMESRFFVKNRADVCGMYPGFAVMREDPGLWPLLFGLKGRLN
jgi:hypothetical protein